LHPFPQFGKIGNLQVVGVSICDSAKSPYYNTAFYYPFGLLILKYNQIRYFGKYSIKMSKFFLQKARVLGIRGTAQKHLKDFHPHLIDIYPTVFVKLDT
jgi:hypothetical protein